METERPELPRPSRMEGSVKVEELGWMGKLDAGGLKLKVATSIVAISGIHLLKRFMEIGETSAPLDEPQMMWLVIIHLTFVSSGVLLALMDWLTAQTNRH